MLGRPRFSFITFVFQLILPTVLVILTFVMANKNMSGADVPFAVYCALCSFVIFFASFDLQTKRIRNLVSGAWMLLVSIGMLFSFQLGIGMLILSIGIGSIIMSFSIKNTKLFAKIKLFLGGLFFSVVGSGLFFWGLHIHP